MIQQKVEKKPKPDTSLKAANPLLVDEKGGYVDPRKIFNNEVQIYASQNGVSQFKPKIAKKRERFQPSKFKIISVSFPTKIPETESTKKKYRIEIKYVDRTISNPIKKQVRVKTISFGTRGICDFVDDKNQKKRISRINLIQKAQDPFSPNHYRLLLLNRCPTLQQAYIKYVNDLGL